MGIGKAVKNLFWQSDDDEGDAAEAAAGDGAELSDEDFASMLAEDPMAVPADAIDVVSPESVNVSTAADGAVSIDFQGQYDAAGIPDTDEVEQLENFLERLDTQLPRASKVAAAQAFLGAIGKGKDDVLADAERKIRRVHGILQAQQQTTTGTIASEQGTIDQLQTQIDDHRARIESLNRELEGVKRACLIEESRLQAARVFFGHVDPPKG
jgi:hypothetical protein